MDQGTGGVSYQKVDSKYFEKRQLKRHAGVWSLWALGVGAVISGEFSGWNLGLATGGWGGLFIATILIAIMYYGLVFCIAEMAPALPHTGGAYSFARTAMGPWGGFITGLCENVEYVVTPAVVIFFTGAYLTGIFGTPAGFQPVWWVIGYGVFLALNIFGVALSFRVTLIVTFLALAVLVIFWILALLSPDLSFGKWAFNIGPDGSALPDGNGPFLPFGWAGVGASLPFAVWFFLAIEELPLASEESVDPKRDMPKGIILGMTTLLAAALLVLWLNPSLPQGSAAYGHSGEPILDGFRAMVPAGLANVLSLAAVIGLVASFHTIIFAKGRQIYSLSRAGYFPPFLSLTHGVHKTPHVAMLCGSAVALAIMLILWFGKGAEQSGVIIGGTLLNMAVFGAMLSYLLQALSFIMLRIKLPDIERPFVSPFGIVGGAATMVIAAVTILYQLSDPVYRQGVLWVAVWFAVAIVYFALFGRRKL
ncbi:MAG: amino acid permease, partial [Aestuariivirga sp.]